VGEMSVAEASTLVASVPGIAALHAVHPGPRFTYVTVNDRAAELLGRSAESLHGVDVTDVFGPGAQLQLAAILERAVESGGPIPFTTVLPFAEPMMMDAVLTPYFDRDGRPVQLLWAAVDAGGERAAKEALARSEARFRSLVDNAFDGVGVLDEEGRYIWTAPSLDRLLGYEPGTLLGMSGFDLVHPDDVAEAARQLSATFESPGGEGTWIGRAKHASGEWRTLEVQGTDLRADPTIGGVVLNVRDITDQHRAEEMLRASEQEYRRLAMHDPLTGLPNRALFDDRAAQSLARLDRSGGMVAVLFCDLDGFKWINDSYGHPLGDRVVTEVGRRIAGVVRDADTVARFGGDEFLVLCADLSSPEEAVATASRLADAVRRPLFVPEIELQLTVSIGIAVTDRSDTVPEELIAQADAAMYEAKRSGRNRITMFDPSLQRRARARMEVSAELRRALVDDQLILHYQPLVDVQRGTVCGVEALVRWGHPDRGLLAPADFIPIAEDTGLIGALGDWVLERACEQSMSWGETTPLNVNLSVRQLMEPALPDRVSRILAISGFPAHRLQLEVTESAVMDDIASAAEHLGRLRDLGVRVGMDDFGTGHSSLAYLRDLPLDFLKIDRSFVARLGHDRRDEAIVGAIVDMAHALGLDAVAEGVETEMQHGAVARLGCDIAQGWYHGRPAPVALVGSDATVSIAAP
jgi:diguanylate cyclase (GGDEF)-like protein/PAS domain S-box-containing protein